MIMIFIIITLLFVKNNLSHGLISCNEPTEEVKVCLNDETNYDINEVPRQYLIRFLEMLTILHSSYSRPNKGFFWQEK